MDMNCEPSRTQGGTHERLCAKEKASRSTLGRERVVMSQIGQRGGVRIWDGVGWRAFSTIQPSPLLRWPLRCRPGGTAPLCHAV
jgi:hypothetical protein